MSIFWGRNRNTIHGDRLTEHRKAHKTHGDRPFMGFLSQSKGYTVKLTQPTGICLFPGPYCKTIDVDRLTEHNKSSHEPHLMAF
jgi:hypothetical protein